MRHTARRRACVYLAGLCLVTGLAGLTGCQSSKPVAASSGDGTQTKWAPPPPPDGETTLISTGDYGFHSPSGNIACHVLDKPGANPVGARCDINVHGFAPPSSPGAGCANYRSMSIGVDGPGEFDCTPPAPTATADVLAYWDSVQVGRFTCKSKDTGVNCENTQTNHGFELGAAAFRRY